MASSQPDQQHPAATTAAVATVAAGAGGLIALDRIRRLYLAGETRALQALRRAVATVLRAPRLDATATFNARWRLDRAVMATANQLAAESLTEVTKAIADAQRTGMATASDDLGLDAHNTAHPERPLDPVVHTSTPFDAPDPADTARRASEVDIEHQRIVTVIHDQYQRIVDKAIAAETGRVNRQRAAQRALDEFAARGISVFTDKAGRQWSISAYVEMVIRTVVAQAQRDAYMARAAASGVTKYRVSHSPTCCPQCRPYDGQILTADELAEATGLFHPNCRHTVTAFRAIDKILPAPRPDMDRYKAEQRLRYLERRVREARRKEAVALDPAALRKARAELRAAWAAIRDHIDDTGLVRQRQREQIIRARG